MEIDRNINKKREGELGRPPHRALERMGAVAPLDETRVVVLHGCDGRHDNVFVGGHAVLVAPVADEDGGGTDLGGHQAGLPLAEDEEEMIAALKEAHGCIKEIIELQNDKVEKSQLEKIILVEVPSKIYGDLRKTFVSLFENSGFKDVKISENVDFLSLYKMRNAQ